MCFLSESLAVYSCISASAAARDGSAVVVIDQREGWMKVGQRDPCRKVYGRRPAVQPQCDEWVPALLRSAALRTKHGFHLASGSDRFGQLGAGANEIGAPSGAEHRHVVHTVAHVVEFAMSEMGADRLELPDALGVVSSVAGDHRLENAEMGGDGLRDRLVGGGSEHYPASTQVLGADELQNIGAIGQRGRVEPDTVAH